MHISEGRQILDQELLTLDSSYSALLILLLPFDAGSSEHQEGINRSLRAWRPPRQQGIDCDAGGGHLSAFDVISSAKQTTQHCWEQQVSR